MEDEINISVSRDTFMSQSKIELPYERGARLFSSRCSEGFEAKQKVSGEKCLIWVLRYPIQGDSKEANEFIARLDNIRTLKLPMPAIVQYSLDNSGLAFLMTDYEKLTPLIDSSWIPIELEDRFVAGLKAVEILHDAKITLGDFGEHTFLLTESKSVVLGSVLGDFDFAAQNTALLPPTETLNYLAPERSITARSDIASDIYALGVFAYRLMTGEYPNAKSFADIKKPSAIRSDLPLWVDAVIGNCLQADPSKRFKDLGIMISVIQASIKSGKVPELLGIWSQSGDLKLSELKTQNKTSKDLVKFASKEIGIPNKQEVTPVVIKNKATPEIKAKIDQRSSLVWIFAVVMGLGIAGFVFLAIGTRDATEPILETKTADQVKKSEDIAVSDPIAFVAEYASAELRPLIIKLADSSVLLEEKSAALAQLAKSPDSSVLEVLVHLIQGNFDIKLKTEAKKFFIEKLNLAGLTTTSGLMQDWINFQTQLSPASTYIFRAVDRGRSAKTRSAALLEGFVKDPILSLRFSAALVLDEDNAEFLDTLRQLLAKEVANEDFSKLGIGALLLSHPSLTIFLDRNLADALSKFSDQDLTSSLLKAAESDQIMLKDLAQEVIRRNIFSPIQMSFIGVLVKEKELGKTSHLFDKELVLAALGKIQSDDLYNFARWDSVDAEKIILAICASSPDLKITTEAFDILAAKSLSNKLTAGFVSWVKSGFWEYRSRLAKAIAIISLADLATPVELEQSLDSLMPFAKGGLFKVIASSDDSILLKSTLARMGVLLTSDDLVSLLSNPNTEIRVEAIKSLKDRNELEVLRAIVAAYDKEKDSEVRKIYNEYHWVTKNRSSKGF